MKRFAARKPVFAPSPQALAERGANALRQGQFKDAAEIFKQLSREDPRPEWTQRLCDAYAGRPVPWRKRACTRKPPSSLRTRW